MTSARSLRGVCCGAVSRVRILTGLTSRLKVVEIEEYPQEDLKACTTNMNLADIQQELRKQKLDGWLFFYYHLCDPLAYLNSLHVRRPLCRWYYIIPARAKLQRHGTLHRVQSACLPAGRKHRWTSKSLPRSSWWTKRAAMAYLPDVCRSLRRDDAGTVNAAAAGVEVGQGPAKLIHIFESPLDPQVSWTIHPGKPAAAWTRYVLPSQLIRERTRNGAPLQEVEIKEIVCKGFADGRPALTGAPLWLQRQRVEPDHQPNSVGHAPIQKRPLGTARYVGQAGHQPGAVYYDITCTGFAATIRATRCAACSPPCAIAVQGTVSR